MLYFWQILFLKIFSTFLTFIANEQFHHTPVLIDDLNWTMPTCSSAICKAIVTWYPDMYWPLWHLIIHYTYTEDMIPYRSASKVDVKVSEAIFDTHQTVPLNLRSVQCWPITRCVWIRHVLRPVVTHPTHFTNNSWRNYYLGKSANSYR